MALPFPSPLTPTTLLCVSLNLTALGTSWTWNHLVSVLCGWRVPLSIMSSRFIHVIRCVRTDFPVKRKHCSVVRTCTRRPHPPTGRHLGCCHSGLSWIVPLWTRVYDVSVSRRSRGFGALPRSGLAGSQGLPQRLPHFPPARGHLPPGSGGRRDQGAGLPRRTRACVLPAPVRPGAMAAAVGGRGALRLRFLLSVLKSGTQVPLARPAAAFR